MRARAGAGAKTRARTHLAHDVWNVISRADDLALVNHAHRNLQVRLPLALLVLVQRLGDPLRNDVLGERETAAAHLLRDRRQVAVDRVDHLVDVARLEKQVKHVDPDFFGEDTPIAPHEVEALHLLLVRNVALGVALEEKRRILLLLQQEHHTVHAIDLDHQRAVQLVHRALQLAPDFKDLVDGALRRNPRVDHDGIGVAVDDFVAQTVGEVHRVLEDRAPLRRNERCDRLREEARVLEAEAAVPAESERGGRDRNERARA